MSLIFFQNMHWMCVFADPQIKSISELKINFIENLGKLLFLKTSQFHYITYNIYYYISMIFIYLNYHIYLSIFNFLTNLQVITSDHIGAMDVSSLFKRNVTTDLFRSQVIILVQRWEGI